MASIRKAKKMGTYKKPSYDKRLYNETIKQVEKVNKRLRSLSRNDDYYSWASKKLFNRLDSKKYNVLEKTSKSYDIGKENKQRVIKGIKLSKNKKLTNTDLKAIQKATQQFLTSKTSTSRGIKEVEEKTKESIYKTMKLDPDTKITREDVEKFYELLGENDFDKFAEKRGASTVWDLLEDAVEMDMSEDRFMKYFEENMGTFVDEEYRKSAQRLYDRYIR